MADLDFIAAARQDIPELVEDFRRTQASDADRASRMSSADAGVERLADPPGAGDVDPVGQAAGEERRRVSETRIRRRRRSSAGPHFQRHESSYRTQRCR